MKKGYSAVVIGGGIVGCATAFELAKRGVTDVLLVEKGFLTSGATGRCGAGIRQQWGSELNARLALESTHIFEQLEEYTGYGRSCELHQGGYLLVAYSEKEWAQFQENLKVQNALGIDARAVDLKEAREIVPILNTEGMYGATFCQKDGHANPFHCTQAYAQGAKRMGVDIATYTAVTGFQVENGHISAVETTAGTVETRLVINCANTRAPGLAKLVGQNRAKEMFFTGAQITAQQAYEWGIVNHVYKKEELDAGLQQILDGILKNDARVLQLVKEIINSHNQPDVTNNAYEEACTSSVCMSSESTLGRLKAFFEGRKKKA